jgi:hypothetical protein
LDTLCLISLDLRGGCTYGYESTRHGQWRAGL